MSSRENKLHAFDRLLTIMDELREQCPWDKKQTIDSLRYLTVEETYELSDAIISGDLNEVKKELGDIILHIVFYSRIASETGVFDISDVLHGICDKLIARHPHIYGDVKVNNEDDVKRNWESLKLKEKGNTSVLGGVPKSLPSMVKAVRIQEKARGVGFDWENKEQVWGKVEEEMQELRVEVSKGKPADNFTKIEAEFGDMMFAMINYARFLGVDPEMALEKTNKKFIRRFQYMEQRAQETGKKLHDMKLEEMDVFWNESKKSEQQ